MIRWKRLKRIWAEDGSFFCWVFFLLFVIIIPTIPSYGYKSEGHQFGSDVSSIVAGCVCLMIFILFGFIAKTAFTKMKVEEHEKPFAVVLYLVAAAVFVLLFAAWFWRFAEIASSASNLCNGQSISFFNAAYFSVETFTTLGFGDFHPAGTAGKLFVMAESMLGTIYGVFFLILFVEGKRTPKGPAANRSVLEHIRRKSVRMP